MTSSKQIAEDAGRWQAVVDFAEGHDVSLLIALGKTVLHGMRQIEDMERFAVKDRLSYETHFPMPDDREWRVTVAPKAYTE